MRLSRLGVLARRALVFALVSSTGLAPAAQAQQQEQRPDGYAISVTVPVVNVDVVVTDDNGTYLTNLKQENFRITEDGKPQVITNFSTTEAPITVVLLVEYSKLGYGWFLYNATYWADAFLRQMKQTDWMALISFSLQAKIEVDFTHNASEVQQGLRSMYFPPFSEANLFDALVDTIDRLQEVEGRKSILILASGYDTFSKLTLDKTLKRLRESDVTINAVGVGERFAIQYLGGGGVEYLQAQNQLRTFATMSGGRAWFPRFDGDIPAVMYDVAASLRHQYSLAYTPTNQATDGKYRKIKVEAVNPDGSPLTVTDAKGKKVKFKVYARQGYQAPTSDVAN